MSDLILGRINLNAEFKKNKPCPVVEIISDTSECLVDGDIVVLKVICKGELWK